MTWLGLKRAELLILVGSEGKFGFVGFLFFEDLLRIRLQFSYVACVNMVNEGNG